MPRVVDGAVEAHGVERLAGLQHGKHGIGELDLAAGAALPALQDAEHLRLQDVAAGDVQVRRRGPLLGLLHHAGDLRHLRGAVLHADDAVLVRLVLRHRGHRDVVAAVLVVRLDHLGEERLLPVMQHVGQDDRERLIADDVARAPDRVAQAPAAPAGA